MAKRKRLRTRRSRIMVVLGFIVVVALAAFFIHRAVAAEATPEVTYSTSAAEKIALTSSVSGVGNVELTNSADVSPSVSGEVTGLSAAVGDKVEEGQLLFTLVNPDLTLALADAENSYNQAVLGKEEADLAVLQAKQSLSDLYEEYAAQSSTTAAATDGQTSGQTGVQNGSGGTPTAGMQGPGGTGSANGFRGGGSFVSGSIIAADDSSITVQTSDGSTKIVLLADSTSIVKTEEASASDLTAGEDVVVTGTTNDDGTVTASNIQLGTSLRVGDGGGTPGTPQDSSTATTAAQ
jgi:hypothetical protein